MTAFDRLYYRLDRYPFYGLDVHDGPVFSVWDESRHITMVVAYSDHLEADAVQEAHDALMAYVESAEPETFACGRENVLAVPMGCAGTEAGLTLAEKLFDEIQEY